MRHFETKKESEKFCESQNKFSIKVHIFKKIKGHKNRIKKPFVVGSEIEWINLY